jgi:hypothetical protein
MKSTLLFGTLPLLLKILHVFGDLHTFEAWTMNGEKSLPFYLLVVEIYDIELLLE